MNISHKSPDQAQRRKCHREAKVDAGFVYSVNGVDHTFQTGLLDRSNVTGRATKVTAKMALGQSVDDFQWRNSVNTMVDFTGAEFLEFAIAMDEFVESQYQDSWNV